MFFYPDHGQDINGLITQHPSHVHPEDENIPSIQDDSDIETEEDWLSGPHPEKSAERMSSKSLEVMRVEVSLLSFFIFPTYMYFFSAQSGRVLQLKWAQ